MDSGIYLFIVIVLIYLVWFIHVIREPILPSFDWNSHIAEIEVCAKENGVIEIDLPKEEWEQLKLDKFASLKPMLSESAFCRLTLLDSEKPERYYLLVAHLGRCP